MTSRVLSRVVLSLTLLSALAFAPGCDDDNENLVTDDGGVDPTGDGGNPGEPDATPLPPDPGACSMTGTQCNNCIDDDQDGLVDGFDPECTGQADNLEGSFATGINGDNIDAKTQDCFFDGNSGGGDDKCAIATCCLLDLSKPPYNGVCPKALGGDNFDPKKDCGNLTPECINKCAPVTPPGCDCFGCCTICVGDTCRDVLTNPAVAPECSQETLNDQAKCPACVKSTTCGGAECNSVECILCPGQTQDDLPMECTNGNVCPVGSDPCTTDGDCSLGSYCSVGCCIAQIG
jgi:hypothetical protein